MRKRGTTWGKVNFGWHGVVILPLEQAATLVDLIASGLCRRIGDYPNTGYTTRNDDGEEMTIPEIEILTDAQYHAAFERGERLLHEKRREVEKAKREAEAKAGAEQAQA